MKDELTDDEFSGQEGESAQTEHETEMLTVDDFADTDGLEDDERTPEPRKRVRWIKVLAISLAVVMVIVCGAVSSFFILRASGEKKLKTVAGEQGKGSGTEATAKKEGHYILYNGKEYRYKEDIINILCMGIDKDIPMEEKRESGSMGLVDTNYAGTEKKQLAYQYAYGYTAKQSCELTREAVSNVFIRFPYRDTVLLIFRQFRP